MFNKLTQVDIYVYKLWALKSQLLTHEGHKNTVQVKLKVSYMLKFTDSENFLILFTFGTPIPLFYVFDWGIADAQLLQKFQVYNRVIQNFLKLYSIYNYCKILAVFLTLYNISL